MADSLQEKLNQLGSLTQESLDSNNDFGLNEAKSLLTPKKTSPSTVEALTAGLKLGTRGLVGGVSETVGNILNSDALKGIAESTRIDNEQTFKYLSTGTQERVNQGYFEDGINGTKLALLAGQVAPNIIPVLGVAGKASQAARLAGLSSAGQTAAGVGAGALLGGAAGGGQASQETRQTLLNEGFTPEEADDAAKQSNLESFLLNAAGTGLSVGLGSAASKIGTKVVQDPLTKAITVSGTQGGLKGGATAALADLPFNAAQGFGEEYIQSKNTGKEFRTENAIDNSVGNIIAGSTISGATGSGFKIRSIPLTEESALNRVEFLTKREPDKQFEAIKESNGKFRVVEKGSEPQPVIDNIPVQQDINFQDNGNGTFIQTDGSLTSVINRAENTPKIETNPSIEEQFNYRPAPVLDDVKSTDKGSSFIIRNTPQEDVTPTPLENRVTEEVTPTQEPKVETNTKVEEKILNDELDNNVREVETSKQAVDEDGNKYNDKTIQSQDELLEKYRDLSISKKAFNRNASDFSNQILKSVTPEGEKHATFGTTIRPANAEKTIENLNSFKETDNFTIKRLPDTRNESTGKDFEHAVGIFRDDKLVGFVDDNLARTIAPEIDSGNFKDIKTKFLLEPIKRGDPLLRTKATINIDGKKYRPVLAISSKYSQDLTPLDNVAKLRNTNKNYQNKTDLVNTKTETINKPEDKELVTKVFKTYGRNLNLAIKDGGKDYLSRQNDVIKNIQEAAKREGIDFDKIKGTYNPETKTVYVNFDSIRAGIADEKSVLNGMDFNDAVDFTVAHEIIGHAALRQRFSTQKQLDSFLNKIYDNYPSIKQLVDEKAKMFDEGLSTNIEEVLSNIAKNKAIVEENGNFRLKDLDDLYKDEPSLLNSLVDVFKSVINTVSGKSMFKLSDTSKMELAEIRKFMKSIGDDLLTSPEIKTANDYLNNPKIPKEEKILTFRYLADNNYIKKGNFLNGVEDRAKIFWDNLTNYNYSKLGNQVGYGQLNKTFKEGFDKIRNYASDAKRYSKDILDPIETLYEKGLMGYTKGPNNFDIKKANELAVLTETEQVRFTDAQLREKGANDAVINVYRNIFKSIDNARNTDGKASLYKALSEARSAFKDTGDYLNTIKNIDDFEYKSYLDGVRDFIKKNESNNAGTLGKLLKRIDDIEETHLKREFDLPRINTTGDYYYVLRDGKGNAIAMENFTSQGARNIALKKLRLKEGEKTEIGNAKLKGALQEGNDKTDNYKKLQEELRENGTYFNVLNNTIKYSDDLGKIISGKINITDSSSYIKSLSKNPKFAQEANDLQKLQDFVVRPDNELVGFLKMVNTLAYLGGNISGGLVNLFSIPMAVIPYMQQYGGTKNIAGAVSLATKAVFNKKGFIKNVLESDYFKGLDRKEVEIILNKLVRNGSLQDIELQDLKNLGRNIQVGSKYYNAKTVLLNSFMYPMKVTEGINRKTTALAALKTALESKDKLNLKSQDDILLFVRDAIDETQGNYSKENRPVWARDGVGRLGELAYQFKTYPLTQLQTMAKYVAKNGDKKSMATMFAFWITMAGANGIPFMEDIDDFADTLGKSLGYNTQSKAWKEEVLKEAFGDTGARIAMFGLLDSIGLPLALGSRLSAGNLIPGSDLFDPTNTNISKSLLEFGGPTGSTLKNAYEGVSRAQAGNVGSGLFQVLPNSVKNIVKGVEAYNDGNFTDNRGNVVKNATGAESLLKLFGFQPSQLSEMYRDMENIRSNSDAVKYFKSKVSQKIARATVDKDPIARQEAIDFMKEWNNKNPTLKFSVDYSNINRLITNMKTNANQRFIKQVDSSLKGEAAKLTRNDDDSDV